MICSPHCSLMKGMLKRRRLGDYRGTYYEPRKIRILCSDETYGQTYRDSRYDLASIPLPWTAWQNDPQEKQLSACTLAKALVYIIFVKKRVHLPEVSLCAA